jgi:peptide deformylase
MIRPIRKHPDKVLRQKAKEVREITPAVEALCAEMVETMVASKGLGLAANQVGVLLRVITVETGSEKQSAPLVVINPEILAAQGEESAEEGCLSIPGFYEVVKRAEKVTVRGATVDGQEQRIECTGMLARAFQHEVDHLDGVLFVDHLSPVKKQLFKREYAKEKK